MQHRVAEQSRAERSRSSLSRAELTREQKVCLQAHAAQSSTRCAMWQRWTQEAQKSQTCNAVLLCDDSSRGRSVAGADSHAHIGSRQCRQVVDPIPTIHGHLPQSLNKQIQSVDGGLPIATIPSVTVAQSGPLMPSPLREEMQLVGGRPSIATIPTFM